jgi:hypothetical protein
MNCGASTESEKVCVYVFDQAEVFVDIRALVEILYKPEGQVHEHGIQKTLLDWISRIMNHEQYWFIKPGMRSTWQKG